ncbi:MAG TPA: acyl-CoA dehydrogenase family protein [Candidatus Binataceae bacterium]|nr:acyl-CoA dehydrogenase family protein [Candidatus Binataceae bacterium]
MLSEDLKRRATIVAKQAAEHADSVDREARFPLEAFKAARQERLLSILVPSSLGGDGASIADVADICYLLARECAAVGMIFAMHQIMVAILVRHGEQSIWHRQLLRDLALAQLLLASSTTEGQGGGDLRTSVAPIERHGTRLSFVKEATVVSYGAEADAIVTTARRAPDAAPTDQVLLAALKSDYRLERTVEWETLGMRGTCSAGFRLTVSAAADQLLPEPYATIQAHTMMPVAHLTWSAVWCGIAAAAVDRARRFVRAAARRSGGQLPPGAVHLTRATMSLRTLQSMIVAALGQFQTIASAGAQLEALDFQNTMNLLKVSASETAIATVLDCLNACGLAGYRNKGEFSISRQLRDILSSAIMINNERILANTTGASMLLATPSTLRA